jgi:hypothetical protein
MGSVNHADSGQEPRPSDDAALFTPRSLLIIVLSVAIGSLVGTGAGVTAGLITAVSGMPWRLLIGLVVGLGAAFATGLSVAAALNGLVGRR